MATEWQLEQEEFHVDQGIGDDQLKLFAENAGINHLEKMILVQALRAYEIRKGPWVNVAGQCFMPVTDVTASSVAQKTPGLGGAQGQNITFTPEKISKLVQLLATTKLENERLRSAALPDRTNAELEKLLRESLPYAWMQSLAVALREYSRMDPNWASHLLAQSIWIVVHEELRNKRRGRNSTMPIPQPQPQGPVAAPG